VKLQYDVVDVFTKTALEGNPLAVFLDGSQIDAGLMQRIAKELNLAETVFLMPPTRAGCDIRVRIFTPVQEMRFAGHPTIGASYVARTRGLVDAGAPQFVLEEQVGPVPVRVESQSDPLLWLRTPPIAKGSRFDASACAQAVGLDASDVLDVPCEIWSAGNPNLYIAVRDSNAVDRAQADANALRALYANERERICTFVFAPTPNGAYSRMFAPNLGVPEDPATGSATGPLAAFMLEYDLAPATNDGARFVSEQGVKMGRRSELHIRLDGDRGSNGIEVGGYVAPLTRAEMTL
jgi:trans-2,3-dihydro-3-hydroxyanthranilate isomerase